MKCNDCKRLGAEDAGRGRTFFRCGCNGRVLESVPNGRTPEIQIPAWCDGWLGPKLPEGITIMKRVKPEWK